MYEAEQLVHRLLDSADETDVRTVEVFGSRLTLPIERRFASLDSIESYFQQVTALNWVRANWSRAAVPIRVRARRGFSAAHYDSATGTVAIPMGPDRWALRELVLLHELAHHLDDLADRRADHGPEFCGRLLELVDGVVGNEVAFLLRICFLETGVPLNPVTS